MRPLHCATIALGAMVLVLWGAIVPATAQINPELPAFEPRIDSTDGGTRGTGSRDTTRNGGMCLNPSDRIVLLTPAESPLTTDRLPGFLAILPPVADETVDFGKLEIYDRQGMLLYEETFPLPDTPGTVKFSPSDIETVELEPGVTYNWSVAILCHPIEGYNPVSTGQFRIAEPSLEVRDRLGDATCSEAPALCASDGIWYDPLVSLFEARLANPDDADLEAAWFSLLESAGLADYAGVRLVDRVELDE